MKPRLGQHFLIDKKIAEYEVALAAISKNDVVLEIGPGLGVLTSLLSKKAKKIIAIEIDRHCIDVLTSKFDSNVEFIHADAAKIDLHSLPRFSKVVSNLPYQISSPFTFHLLNYSFEKAVLIYQLEFAERMVAQPGSKTYSRLSVGVQYKTICSIKKVLPPQVFRPQPRIQSAIVTLVPRKHHSYQVIDESFFYLVTKILFSHRRKKIGTTIHKYWKISDPIPYEDMRVEALTIDQIAEISNFLFENKVSDVSV